MTSNLARFGLAPCPSACAASSRVSPAATAEVTCGSPGPGTGDSLTQGLQNLLRLRGDSRVAADEPWLLRPAAQLLDVDRLDLPAEMSLEDRLQWQGRALARAVTWGGIMTAAGVLLPGAAVAGAVLGARLWSGAAADEAGGADKLSSAQRNTARIVGAVAGATLLLPALAIRGINMGLARTRAELTHASKSPARGG